ncbi:BspA family leucine-rich repeat surface protein [Cognataquiflexum rubidum]|uniref:BspA family leucine-rich repeat surface protein n=1 Tax=Cognataquiflexum rubidum TaxID=2922273 RepID=UPI001F13D28B|nr:BspA family leucine-rich repeat surface protein [Cognataquiflexum rubidum]MCH6236186.1 BspA family leucine-rich repeat surface protein [Cognataquiflexum rubidum]
MKTLRLFQIVLFTTLFSCSEEKYLSMSVFPIESGQIDSSVPPGPIEQGQSVTLTALANENWVFLRWAGAASGTANPLVITMDSDKSIEAVFVKKDFLLEYTIVGEGKVFDRIIENPSGRKLPHGTMVELTPVPKEGWVFESWIIEDINAARNLISNDNPKTISIDGRNFLIRAVFVSKPQGEARFFFGENGVTCKCENVISGQKGILNGVEFEAVNNELLRQKVNDKADLTKVCTSLVTDMSQLFNERNFNQPIRNWDVSNVTNMSYMFSSSGFNQPIDAWDVSNVANMSYMFTGSSFNQPIGKWDVSNVTNMKGMFEARELSQSFPDGETIIQVIGEFNQPIGEWDVSKVTNMDYMFSNHPKFNQDLSNWCVVKIPVAPTGFSNNTWLWVLPKPVWGSCPD